MVKLSELVAVEVMGDKPEVSQQVSNDGGESSAFGNDDWSTRHIDIHAWLAEKQARGLMTDYKVVEWKRYPAYDTNMADAWRVVEKMEHREPIVRRIVPLPREDGKPRWRCLMLASDDPEDVEHHWIEEDEYTISRRACVVEDENVCVAICLAALRACGVSDDRIEQARRKA